MTFRRLRRTRYSGVLARQMTPHTIGKARQQFDRRIDALFRHFEIDPECPRAYQQLALALAFAHVPGFRIGHKGRDLVRDDKWRRKGRPRTRSSSTEKRNLQLLEEKRREIAQRNHTSHGALAIAIRALSRAGQPFHGIDERTVRKKYERFCKAFGLTASGDVALDPTDLCTQGCFSAEDAENLDLTDLEARCRAFDTCPLIAHLSGLRDLLSAQGKRMADRQEGLDWLDAQQPAALRRKRSRGTPQHGD